MSVGARRIGLLGGTFDPIHCGHLDVADAAQRALQLTRVFVITSNLPPHRPQPYSSAFHRFAMVALAVSDRPDWRATDLELRSDAPSYTSFTLAKFHERGFAATELFFIIGADAFAEDRPARLRDAVDNSDRRADRRCVIDCDPSTHRGGRIDPWPRARACRATH